MAINLTEGKRAEARSLVGKLVRILVGLGKDETCKQEIEKILKEIG